MMNKYIKKFEAYREKYDEFTTVESINRVLGYEWSPSDRQVWRYDPSGDKQSSFIFRIDGTERSGRGKYRKLFRELPSWRKFTNRLSSVIGTTSIDYAKSWRWNTPMEDIYAIIPLRDEVYVGVNEDVNLQGTFPYLKNIIGEDLMDNVSTISEFLSTNYGKEKLDSGYSIKDMDRVNKDMDRINNIDIEKMKDDIIEDIEKYKETYEDLSNKYRNVSQTWEIASMMRNMEKKIKFHKIYKFAIENNVKNGLELFDKLLDPIKNGYRKMKYTDLIKEILNHGKSGLEVWFECDCIFINNDILSLMEKNN